MSGTRSGTESGCRAGDAMDERSCKTCRHRRKLGEDIKSACVGCLKNGECTKWEDDGNHPDYLAQIERMKHK